MEENKLGIKTNKEELFKLYKKTIKQPMFDDLVLIVLGGEKGVIAEYFEKNIKFSKLIVIEPITALGNDPQTQNNYKNFKIRNKGNIIHFTLKEIEDNPADFNQLLIKNQIIEKGLQIINNPFYEIHYSNEMIAVKNRINNILDNIKPVVKMNLTNEMFIELQKKNHLKNDTDLKKEMNSEISKVKAGKLIVLIGFETGTLYGNLIKTKKAFNVAIVEPYKSVFDQNQIHLLEDIRKITNTSHEHFEFEKGNAETLKFFDYISKKAAYLDDIEFLINPKYIKKYYKETIDTLKKVRDIVLDIASLKGNSNGDDIYGIMNSLYNLRGIGKLKLLPKDLTYKNVITVAAGPSLDDHMDELKALSKKFPVIAVEVVVDKLLKNGIFPDIVCSQERTLIVFSDYIRKFDDSVKKKSVYIAPALIHTYSLDEMENIVLVSQAIRSTCEKYIYDFYYNFASPIQTSIHAGLIAINIALLFKPENIIIFGHDVSVPIDKRSHAEDIKANNYYRENSEIIIGNRGQKVYLPPLLKKFYNNTENITLRIKNNKKINFYNFSDGAKITAFDDSNDIIYTQLLHEKNEEKELYKKLISTKIELKEKTIEQLYSERQTLEEQLEFLSQINTLTRFTLNLKFLELIINKPSILSKSLRLLMDDFVAKNALIKDDMATWINENKGEITETAIFLLQIINNTINLLQNDEQLPLYDSEDIEKLYTYNFFAVIRNKFLDAESNPKENITEEEFFYLIQSFLHAFQPLDYLKFVNILLAYKNRFTATGINKPLYQQGITRCIDFFYTKVKELKNEEDEKPKIFIREHLISLLYEAERYDEIISLVNSHDNPTLFELDLLADTYNEIGRYDTSFFIYKELLKNNLQNKKLLLNTFNNLVFLDKYAESLYFSNIIREKYKDDPVYNANYNYLKEKISTFKREQKAFNLKFEQKEPLNQSHFVIINKAVLDDDNIVELLGKQQNIQFTRVDDRYYFDKLPDTTFFIDDIPIIK